MVIGAAVPAAPASWLAKLTLGGTEIADCVATPESAIDEGFAPLIVKVAERGPAGVAGLGVNVTPTWQFAPAAMLGGQELVQLNSESVTLIVPKPAAVPLALETVIVWEALVVLMLCEPKARLPGEAFNGAGAAVAVALSETC